MSTTEETTEETTGEAREPWTKPEIGETYQDVMHPQIKGVCTGIKYHKSGCTSLHLAGSKNESSGDPVSWDVLVTRLEGYVGDPSDHPAEVKEILSKRYKHTELDITGFASTYTNQLFRSDTISLSWLKNDGDFTSASFDLSMLRAIEDKKEPAAIKTKKATKETGPSGYDGPAPSITV